MRCPSCGQENPEGFRFCGACASPLEAASPPREQRKTVTVIFCDVTGSTSLGEQLDPESLRQVMERYFDSMKAVIESHGGTVEKFIGDAVMAIFGVPVVREDDALRAVRAAAEMREALAALNQEFEERRGVRIEVRTGVNTGEVVAGEGAAGGQRLATGDAVNVAARLEQAAEPGTILLGPTTHRLVRDAVHAELTKPLTLKGKSEPVRAHRLISVDRTATAGTARRTVSSLVGRERERTLLAEALRRAIADRACHLFTILGVAGVGKSRLLADVIEHAGADVQVLTGRCLPYGDGITFWPVLEMLKQAGGISETDPADVARDKVGEVIQGLPQSPAIAAELASLLGLEAGSGTIEETYWAVRVLLETLARRKPLVTVIDDLQWAEPALLELVEHIADWSRDAPIVLVCLARPELLETRPTWGGGKMNATSVLLEPLSEAESVELTANLLGRAGIDEALSRKITEAAGGNPLFVEEMVSMLIDDGLLARADGGWVASTDLSEVSVPPTIQALLAARLDRLQPGEWSVVEGASVIGQVFYRGALSALAPEGLRPDVSTYLKALIRKDLVRPDADAFGTEETYRFRHILIRDAAYQAMPKQTRAELHERFADWLETAVGERLPEYQEIVGYHLEQAIRHRDSLGVDVSQQVRSRAIEQLVSAGWRASDRGDVAAAVSLLRRAGDLETAPLEELRLRLDIAEMQLLDGRVDDVQHDIQGIVELAESVDDDAGRWHALLIRDFVSGLFDPASDNVDARIASTTAAISALEELGDDTGLVYAWLFRGLVEWLPCRFDTGLKCVERALEYAIRTGDTRRSQYVAVVFVTALALGSAPREEIQERLPLALTACREGVTRDYMELLMSIEIASMRGDVEGARALVREALERARTIGSAGLEVQGWIVRATAENRFGDIGQVADASRHWYELLVDRGDVGEASTAAAILAESLAEVGDADEAERFASIAIETSSPDDVWSRGVAKRAFARIAARRGDLSTALAQSREAVAIWAEAECPEETGRTFLLLAEVALHAASRAEAMDAASTALTLFQRKGIEPLMTRANEVLRQCSA